MQHWAYIHFPHLLLDVRARQAPHLAQGLALYDESSLLVLQVDQVARQAGIEPGMTLSDAWVLCEGLHAEPFVQDAEAICLRELAAQLYTDFADISLNPHSTGCWLQLSTMRKLLKSDGQLHSCLQQHLAATEYQLGLAKHPRCAQLLACCSYANGDVGQVKIEHTPLPDGAVWKLLQMGVTQVAQLQAIPSQTIGKKLGHEVVGFLAQLNGSMPLKLPWFRPDRDFYHTIELPAEVHHWHGLRFACRDLTRRLQSHLRRYQLAAMHLHWVLHFRTAEQQPVVLNMATPQVQADHFYALFQLAMEQTQLQAPVTGVSLQVTQFEALVTDSGELAGVPSAKTDRSLSPLINRLVTRLGDKINGLVVTPSWLPEQSQQAAPPLTVTTPTPGSVRYAAWLLTKAEPINIEHWQLLGALQRLAVPWWQQDAEAPPVHRDYSLARDQAGRYAWLYFDNQQRAWYLQGWAS